MKKKIMILGGSILQLPMIRRAKEMGLYTIVLDYNSNAIGFNESDKSYTVSTNDIEGAIKIAEKEMPNGVVTMATDMPMRTVAKIGEKFNLNTISFDSAMKATDKFLMRKQLFLDNVPIPIFYEIKDKSDFFEVIKKFENKFIVKPSDSSGSKGVVLCDKSDDLTELANVFQEVMSYSASGYILIEEFMDGPEVSVESLTIDGETKVVAITDKKKTDLPYFVEVGHSIPSTLNEDVQNEVKKITIAAIKSLEINTGPTHTELIITKEGPKVVEIGARLGGDNITSHLVPLATGVDIVGYTIKLALGEKVKYKSGNELSAAIRYFHGEKGKLKFINNIDELKNTQGIKEIVLTKKIGDVIKEIHSSNDRLGFVIVQKNKVCDAISTCEEVIKKIQVTIE